MATEADIRNYWNLSTAEQNEIKQGETIVCVYDKEMAGKKAKRVRHKAKITSLRGDLKNAHKDLKAERGARVQAEQKAADVARVVKEFKALWNSL